MSEMTTTTTLRPTRQRRHLRVRQASRATRIPLFEPLNEVHVEEVHVGAAKRAERGASKSRGIS
jgi:hypothetical protein